MKKQIIGKGAEAIIYLDKDSSLNKTGQEGGGAKRGGRGIVTKDRISKSYRHPELDKKIIKRRTKSETKILTAASKIINVPIPEKQEENNLIKMPHIEGLKLSEHLDSFSEKKQEKIMFQMGQSIAKLHKEGIVHGDLTTSNMIYSKNKIFFIDFGLGYFNGKYEDKGVDIHLLKQALEAKHFKNWETLFKEFEIGYSSIDPLEAEKVFNKLNAIEKRGRYKH